jgi:hypothetical protein
MIFAHSQISLHSMRIPMEDAWHVLGWIQTASLCKMYVYFSLQMVKQTIIGSTFKTVLGKGIQHAAYLISLVIFLI